MNKLFILILAILFTGSLHAQDMDYTKKLVNDLSSPAFCGRGYVKSGDSIAAVYLSKEMKKLKLKSFSKNYYQDYHFSVNTFPTNPILKLDGKELKAAKDFIVFKSCPKVEGEADIRWINKDLLTNSRALRKFLKEDHSNEFLAIDSTGLKNPELYRFAQIMMKENVFKAKGVIVLEDKLKFSAGTKIAEHPTFVIKPEFISTSSKKISYRVDSKLIPNYKTQNLIGYIKGKTDTCIVMSAHYDHLGFLGDNMYPGANDNASGVAMVMNLAKQFKAQKKKPHYTLVFALFSGEEAGLLGSTHYSEHPFIPLAKTKMVINFDMLGTGSKGIFMINGKEVPDLINQLNEINKKEKYVFKMFPTGASSSSDHAPFHKKGVKALFVYTHGDNADYHETTDTAEKLPYTQFEGIFKMMRDFVMQQ